MNNLDFAEATGLIRAIEKKILSDASFDRLIDVASVDETLKVLSQNSEYDFSAASQSENYEEVLKTELKRLYSMIYKLSPHGSLVDVLSTKYDYHNIKVAIKANFLGQVYDNLFIYITDADPGLIKAVITNDDTKSLPEHIVTAVKEGVAAFESSKDPQVVDIVLDKLMFDRMLSICEEVDNEFVTKYVQYSIDFCNAKTLLRVKSLQKGLKFLSDALIEGGLTEADFFLSQYDKPIASMGEGFYYKPFGHIMKFAVDAYEKSGNFSSFEKLADNFLIDHVKEAKYIAYGAEPIFAYIVAKENEIKQVRILLTCKANNIATEVLRERLRDNYV